MHEFGDSIFVERAIDPDPAPEPPLRPEAADCCRGGCDPCVFEVYEQALARYQEALRQWHMRHPGERS